MPFSDQAAAAVFAQDEPGILPGPTLLWFLLAGAGGGFASFLVACRKGRIRNNKYVRKAAIETLGGGLAGFFLQLMFTNMAINYRIGVAFIIGAGWSQAVEFCRERVSAVVIAALRAAIDQDAAGGGRTRGSSSERDQDSTGLNNKADASEDDRSSTTNGA